MFEKLWEIGPSEIICGLHRKNAKTSENRCHFSILVLRAVARFKTTVPLYAREGFRSLYLIGTITVTRGQAVNPLASVCHKEWVENAAA